MPKQNHHKLFIFAGEHSGDLHGGHLLKELKKRHPAITIEGVAGPKMRDAGVERSDGIGLQMEDFSVMGITDVLFSLPKLCRNFFKVRNYILKSQPDATLLIDYPGFNLRLARSLRKHGYQGKIIQYISPTIWAHGQGRIKTMEQSLDLLMTIFPFEEQYLENTKLPVSYVGNPLSEYIKNYPYNDQWREELNIPRTDRMIALFPGSRAGEISRNLPIMLEAAEKYHKEHPETIFAISNVNAEMIASHPLKDTLYCIPKKYTYELMRDCRTAIAKSGTVTLELALHRKPAIVIYKLSWLNKFYAQKILKLNLPFYCMANILKGEEVYPELIAEGVDANRLYELLEIMDNDGIRRYESLSKCTEIKHLLGDHDASAHAAEMVFRELTC